MIYTVSLMVDSYVLSREEMGHICVKEGKYNRVRERFRGWKEWCNLFLSQEVT